MAKRAVRDSIGVEPINTTISNERELGAALSWYSRTDYREMSSIAKFMRDEGYTEAQISKIESREKHIENSIFAMSRLLTFNAVSLEYRDHVLQRMKDRIKTHLQFVEEKVAAPKPVKKSDRVNQIIEDLEATHDLIVSTNGFVKFVFDFTPTDKEKEALVSFYQPKMVELVAVRDKTDPELVEAYRKLSANTLSRLIEFYSQIVSVQEIKKITAVRKPRKKRKPNFSKLKYMVEDTATGLKSIDPVVVHDCSSTLIVYNTKYDSVTVYVAEEGKFLEFKRTSVINFDETKSYTKRAGRSKNLVDTLKMSSSKKNILHVIEAINSKPSKASSLISDCVILVKGFPT